MFLYNYHNWKCVPKAKRRGGKKWRKKAPDKLETARVVLEMLAYIATVASLVWQIVKG